MTCIFTLDGKLIMVNLGGGGGVTFIFIIVIIINIRIIIALEYYYYYVVVGETCEEALLSFLAYPRALV
jgi:hypothetical protein